MGAVWLYELADVLRNAGVNVVEYDGWQSRARSSGGYEAMPLCVMWHHTASPASWNGQKDADYIATGDEDAPIANLYIDRQGLVWVIAAGASNTNGKGYGRAFSRGTVPNDRMNEYAIGVEMGNDGIGEAYPQEQIDAIFAASNACNAWCGNTPLDVCTHNEWAPDRKIDPATSFAVQGPWQPDKSTSSGTWDLSDIQNECVARAGGHAPLPPFPTPTPEDDEMRLSCFLDANGTIWVGNGIHRHGVPNMDVFSNYVVLSISGGGSPMYSANGVLVRELSDVATVGQSTIDAMGVPV